MKRIIPIIVIIVVLLAIGFFVSRWLAFSFGLTFLGTLGYLERIVKISLSRKWSVSLLIIFLLFSGAYNVTNFIKAKHSEGQIDDLNKKDGSAKKQIADLAGKVAESQQEIKARDAQIVELERQAKVIRTIDGVIECVFSGNWRKHPGSLVPIGWNKKQVYARIFEKNETENGAILFLLDSIGMTKLPDGNLQVTLTVRAKVGTGPLGQEFGVLKKYSHLSVYIPFIDRDVTFDNRIMLEELRASFFVNGEKKSQLKELQSFEIPIPEGKALGLQVNTKIFS